LGCGRLSQGWRTATFLRGPSTCSVKPLSQHPSTINDSRMHSRGHGPLSMTELRVGLGRNRDRPLSDDANSYWQKKFQILRIGYPLSESVAPPGTAWDAEGPRGNEANENKSMVLVPAQARKGQSGSLFAQEDMTFGECGFRASGFGLRRGGGKEEYDQEKALRRSRSAVGACAAYGDTLNVIVKGVLELVIAVPPVGAPVVALMVTV